jgi:hypothetical protein
MDEDMMSHSLVNALRSRGIDVKTVLEEKREGFSDESQLKWATREGRIICTANIADFIQLHIRFIEIGQEHSGIILVTQQQYSVGGYLRALMKLISSKTAEDMVNQIEFLSDYLRIL